MKEWRLWTSENLDENPSFAIYCGVIFGQFFGFFELQLSYWEDVDDDIGRLMSLL